MKCNQVNALIGVLVVMLSLVGCKPSGTPSDNPSGTPSDNPSGTPSDNPSSTPSDNPSDGLDTKTKEQLIEKANSLIDGMSMQELKNEGLSPLHYAALRRRCQHQRPQRKHTATLRTRA